jgi:hypothetical protein
VINIDQNAERLYRAEHVAYTRFGKRARMMQWRIHPDTIRQITIDHQLVRPLEALLGYKVAVDPNTAPETVRLFVNDTLISSISLRDDG